MTIGFEPCFELCTFSDNEAVPTANGVCTSPSTRVDVGMSEHQESGAIADNVNMARESVASRKSLDVCEDRSASRESNNTSKASADAIEVNNNHSDAAAAAAAKSQNASGRPEAANTQVNYKHLRHFSTFLFHTL